MISQAQPKLVGIIRTGSCRDGIASVTVPEYPGVDELDVTRAEIQFDASAEAVSIHGWISMSILTMLARGYR